MMLKYKDLINQLVSLDNFKIAPKCCCAVVNKVNVINSIISLFVITSSVIEL